MKDIRAYLNAEKSLSVRLVARIVKTYRRTSAAVPNMLQRADTEPWLTTPLPSVPWQKVAMDIFKWEKRSYLLMVDYYSRFIEVTRLGGLSTEALIGAVKGTFARHGVPEEVISDNAPQFSLRTFQNFSREYGF